jgi:hypothetical protein
VIASTVTESSAQLATRAKVPGAVDRHGRGLLADLDGGDLSGR